MFVGDSPWQDYPLGDIEPVLAGVVEVVPVTGYDGRWWRMVQNQQVLHGGRDCNYIPRTPANTVPPLLASTVIINLTTLKTKTAEGAVQIIGKRGIIAAREWYLRGFTSRPQRGDTVETGQETFYVEDVEVVERKAPDGIVRDLKFRLDLSGAGHRR